MALTIDLVTRARAQLNPALAGVSDAYLDIQITAASTQIQRWCNRFFTSQEFIQKRDGEGYQTIFLPNFPVTVITQVDFRSQDGTITAVMPNGATVSDYFFIGDGGEIDFVRNNPSDFIRFPEGFKNILITYTGGFSPVPEDIQEACVEQIVFLIEQGSASASVKTEKLGDYSKTFFDPTVTGSSNLSNTAFQILSSYRRMLV